MSDPQPPGQVDQSTDGQRPAGQTLAPVPASKPAPAKHHWDAMTRATIATSVGTLAALAVALLGLRATFDSLRYYNLATIYGFSQDVTKFFEAHPELNKFFDKEFRPPMTDQQLWDAFHKLPEDQQVMVKLGCMRIADFTQMAFLQRKTLPADDWDTWWSSMTDQYDECPMYRDYLAKRPTWYAFDDAIRPENRAKYYRGSQRK
jgi:hypothetical protein